MSFLANRIFHGICVLLLLSAATSPAITKKPAKRVAKVARKIAAPVAPVITAVKKTTVRTLRGPWRVPTYADSTEGDRIEGELVAEPAKRQHQSDLVEGAADFRIVD